MIDSTIAFSPATFCAMSAITVKVVTALNFSAERWLVNMKHSKMQSHAMLNKRMLLIIFIANFLSKLIL